jgi:hypothetical protein
MGAVRRRESQALVPRTPEVLAPVSHSPFEPAALDPIVGQAIANLEDVVIDWGKLSGSSGRADLPTAVSTRCRA